MRKPNPNPCSVEDCTATVAARNLCNRHYRRMRDSGNLPAAPYRTRGTGTAWRLQDGYVIRQIFAANKRTKIWQHREVMEDHLGRPLLPEETVHHKNGIRSDNQIDNLELWSTSQPYGQRVTDKVAWAKEILARYEHAQSADVTISRHCTMWT